MLYNIGMDLQSSIAPTQDILKHAIVMFKDIDPRRVLTEKDLRWMSFPKAYRIMEGPSNDLNEKGRRDFQITLIQCKYFRQTLIYADDRYQGWRKYMTFKHPKV